MTRHGVGAEPVGAMSVIGKDAAVAGVAPERVGDVTLEARAARGAFWVGGGSLSLRFSGVIGLAVVAGHVQPRQFGLLSVAVLASNVLVMINALGFGDAVVYEQEHPKEASETALVICGVTSFSLTLALLAAAPYIATFFHVPDATNVVRAYAVVVLASGLTIVPLSVLTRELAFERRFVPEAIPPIIGAAITVVLAERGAGVWSLVIGDGTRAVLALVLAISVLREPIVPRWHRDVASSAWKYSRASLASSMLDFGLQNVDYVLVGRLLGPVALGYYTLAFRLAILPFVIVAFVVAGVSFPLYSRLMPDRERVTRAFRSWLRIGSNATFVLAGGVIALAPSLVLLGPRWAPAVGAARALGVYVCLRSVAHLFTPLAQATGRPGAVAVLRASWIVTLALLIWAVAHRGITAVAVAQVVAAVIFLVAHAELGRRIIGVSPRAVARDVARASLALVAGVVCVTALRHVSGWLDHPSWPSTAALGVAFVLAYAVTSLPGRTGVRGDLVQLRLQLNEGRPRRR